MWTEAQFIQYIVLRQLSVTRGIKGLNPALQRDYSVISLITDSAQSDRAACPELVEGSDEKSYTT